jgi:hypothetical protein
MKRTGTKVPSFSSGPVCQKAKNSGVNPPAPKSIAGYGAMKTSGGSRGPTMSAGPGGYNAPSCNVPGPKMSGGPSRSGPSITQGGTSSPTSKRGPSGLGLSGSQYPTGGGG